MGARVRTAGIGLGLILLGIATYAGVDRWMSTRIVRPVDMPISFKAGHIHTGPFRLNLWAEYWVTLSPNTDWRWESAHPECNPYRHLQTRWVLYRNGEVVDRLDEPVTLPWPSGFSVGPGVYDLDLEVLTDFSCVDPHPELEIYAQTGNYESGVFAVKVVAVGIAFLGLVVFVFVPVVRVYARQVDSEESKTRLTDSTTAVGQNFQWAQRLPLRRRIAGLPGFGLVGGLVFAILAMVMMMLTPMVMLGRTPRGLWVHLLKVGAVAEKSDGWAEPLIVRLKDAGPGNAPTVFLDSNEVTWDEFPQALKSELARRREWVVYVAGDDCVAYANIAQVIDIAHGEHAKVILLTEKHGEQTCFPPAGVRGMTQ